jgi:hypothetical protein
MPTLRTKQEVTDRFEGNQDFKNQAKTVLEQPWFQAWLDAVLVNMGPYSIDATFSPLPHIQDRQDGGKAAINHFLHRLTSLPYRETHARVEHGDEYIGFDTSSSVQTATKVINKP